MQEQIQWKWTNDRCPSPLETVWLGTTQGGLQTSTLKLLPKNVQEMLINITYWIKVSDVSIAKIEFGKGQCTSSLLSWKTWYGGQRGRNMTWVAQTQVGLKPVSMDGFQSRIFPCSNKEQFERFRTDLSINLEQEIVHSTNPTFLKLWSQKDPWNLTALGKIERTFC